jgi:hypothetical protein
MVWCVRGGKGYGVVCERKYGLWCGVGEEVRVMV